MKKLLLGLCLIAVGMNAQTNTTQTINSKLKLTNVPLVTNSDTLLVRDADKIVKKLPIANLPVPTLQKVLTSGNLAIGTGINFQDPSDNSISSGLSSSGLALLYTNSVANLDTAGLTAFNGFFTVKGSKRTSLLPDGLHLRTGTGFFDGLVRASNLTTNRSYDFPDASGTIALESYVDAKVGDFINDSATTMAPSQNAVYDALALKADTSNIIPKTGDVSNITGLKHIYPNTGATVTNGLTFENASTQSNSGNIYSKNTATGIGIYSENQGAGVGILSNGSTSSTGYNFLGQNNGTNTWFVTKTGTTIVGGNTDDGVNKLQVYGSMTVSQDFRFKGAITHYIQNESVNNISIKIWNGSIDIIPATFKPDGSTELGGVLKLKSYTVSTLPAGTEGATAYVTDATAPTYLGTLTGGGSVKCPVFYNGTAWVSH